LHFRAGTAAAAGWVVVFFMLPFTAANRFGFPVGYLVPNFPEMVAVTAVVLALFFRVGKGNAFDAIWRSLLITLLMVWSVTALPGVVPVAFAPLFVYGLGFLMLAEGWRERRWKLACGVFGLIVLV